MPRSVSSTGPDYASRAPQPHEDARSSTPRPRPAREPEPPRDDTGAPTSFMTLRDAHVPGGASTQWVRRVKRVRLTGTGGIRMFVGDYHAISGGRIEARTGDVFLVCSASRTALEYMFVYLLLPDDVWYLIPTPCIRRLDGWHRLLRNVVSDWTSLSKVQRVLRACNTSRITLNEALHQLANNAGDRRELIAARNHFADMTVELSGDFAALTTDAIRRSFDAWSQRIAVDTSTNVEEVVQVLSDVLADPVPQTSSMLSAQVTELADTLEFVLPGFNGLSSINVGAATSTNELTKIQRLCDGLHQAVRDEQQQREWQYNVLRQLAMTRVHAAEAALDRSLTDMLTNNEHGTAAAYLDRHYSFYCVGAQIGVAINHVANEGPTERHTSSTIENREMRNIQLGRKHA